MPLNWSLKNKGGEEEGIPGRKDGVYKGRETLNNVRKDHTHS